MIQIKDNINSSTEKHLTYEEHIKTEAYNREIARSATNN